MQVRFVERSGEGATLSGTMSVADFEGTKIRSHERALGKTEESSALCGVSKWFDNRKSPATSLTWTLDPPSLRPSVLMVCA